MAADKAAEARQALLECCHLGTLTMVHVWEKLLQVVAK
jgi:hypothetical protein